MTRSCVTLGLTVVSTWFALALLARSSRADCAPDFTRGDANCDGRMDVSDAVVLLRFLFVRGERPCLDAADADDDGELSLLDALRILGHLTAGAARLPPPFPGAGSDPSMDGLGCSSGGEWCAGRSNTELVGAVTDPEIREPSGVALSRKFPDLLWAVNDSGNPPWLHVMTRTGEEVKAIRLCASKDNCPQGATSPIFDDWEGLAVGVGPDGSEVVYIGDTGNNPYRQRARLWIHRIPVMDPRGDFGKSPLARDAGDFSTLFIEYPPGAETTNAEVLLLDPANGLLYLASDQGDFFRYPGEERPGETVVLEPVGKVDPFGSGRVPYITGGSLSPDGRWMALKAGPEVRVFSWTSGDPRDGLAAGNRCRLNLVEYIGLALQTFHAGEVVLESASSFITLEEQGQSPIFRLNFSGH